MQIFATGSASFIAAELISHCENFGVQFSGCDLLEQQHPDCHRADIRDPDLCDVIDENTEVLVHLAAISREADCKGQMDQWMDINVLASRNVMLSAHRRGVRRFVFASSEWVYDFDDDIERREDDDINPMGVTSEYGLSKLMAECLLRQTALDMGVSLTVLRFGIVYGAREKNWSAVEKLLHSVATQDRITVGSLNTARRFVHVNDIASAILLGCTQANAGTYNIQGPRLTSLRDVIATAKSMTRRDPDVVERDSDAASIRPVSSALAERELGWRPQIDIERGMRKIAPVILRQCNA